jgi:transcriptional regulator with XRE-family HTH domain
MGGRSMQMGRRIREARRAAGLSQTVIGERLHPPVTHSAISRMEQGHVELSLDRIEDVATALGMSFDALMGWESAFCPCCGSKLAS